MSISVLDQTVTSNTSMYRPYEGRTASTANVVRHVWPVVLLLLLVMPMAMPMAMPLLVAMPLLRVCCVRIGVSAVAGSMTVLRVALPGPIAGALAGAARQRLHCLAHCLARQLGRQATAAVAAVADISVVALLLRCGRATSKVQLWVGAAAATVGRLAWGSAMPLGWQTRIELAM